VHDLPAEFAAYGIAGARVDRITATAGVNNALLYRYFGSKSELFDTVFGTLAAELLEAVPFTLDDLPGYAGALIDYYAQHPAVVRLAAWHRLEPGDRPLPGAVRTSQEDLTARIEQAQAAGRITTTYTAAGLLNLILALTFTQTGAGAAALRPEPYGGATFAEHKRMVTAAVAAILAS
jgi:AcrR family transcriptional regulator